MIQDATKIDQNRRVTLTRDRRVNESLLIDQYRRHPTPADLAATGRETSIRSALRIQLATKDNEIRTLKAQVRKHESTIALLYGQLDSQSS